MKLSITSPTTTTLLANAETYIVLHSFRHIYIYIYDLGFDHRFATINKQSHDGQKYNVESNKKEEMKRRKRRRGLKRRKEKGKWIVRVYRKIVEKKKEKQI